MIKTAIDVNKAVLLEITIQGESFNIARVLELTVEPVPIKISVIINNTFFYSTFNISSSNNHYQF